MLVLLAFQLLRVANSFIKRVVCCRLFPNMCWIQEYKSGEQRQTKQYKLGLSKILVWNTVALCWYFKSYHTLGFVGV